MKFWITDKDEIITFPNSKEHYEVAEDNGFSYSGVSQNPQLPDALESGWIRGTFHGHELSFECLDIEDNFRRISDVIDKIPNSAKAEVIGIDVMGGDFIQIPREMVDKVGLERAYYRIKKNPSSVYASKKDKLLDEIKLGNWNIVQDWITSLQTELSPEEFEEQYSPLAIATEMVKEMGKDGLNLAKEYADKIFSGETEKDSVFQDGVYSLDRNKTGVPFEMEPTSGPYPRGLVPVQKDIGDISFKDRISVSISDITGLAMPSKKITKKVYYHST